MREMQLHRHKLDPLDRLSLVSLLASFSFDVGCYDKCADLRLQCVNDGALARAAAETKFSLLVATGEVLQKRMQFGDAAKMYERARAVIPNCVDMVKNGLVLLLLLRQAELRLKLGEISSAGSIVLLPTEHYSCHLVLRGRVADCVRMPCPCRDTLC